MPAKPKPTRARKTKKASGPKRKILEKQIEEMVKLIVAYRDGQQCVMRNFGGCGNGLMWNHLIAQGQSHWLKFDLGNVHWGCGNHNLLDYRGSKVFSIWFVKTFGIEVLEALETEKQLHRGASGKRSIPELEAMLYHYTELYQNRYVYIGNGDLQDEVEHGYYGMVVKTAFRPRGQKDR